MEMNSVRNVCFVDFMELANPCHATDKTSQRRFNQMEKSRKDLAVLRD